MIKSLKLIVIVLAVLLSGCKSAKSVTNKGVLDSKITSKELIRAHKRQAFKFKTLQSKVKVEYTQDNKSQSYSINLRMEKDKTIHFEIDLNALKKSGLKPDLQLLTIGKIINKSL